MLLGGAVVISFDTETEHSWWMHWISGVIVLIAGYLGTLMLILWLRA
jgi:hypothetical protein